MQIANKSDICQLITDIKEGDKIPTSPYNKKAFPNREGGYDIIADISSFSEIFERATSRYEYKKRNRHFGGVSTYRNIRKEAEELGITPELYLRISCIQDEISMLNVNTDEEKRMGILRDSKNKDGIKLSTMMFSGMGMCTESSILSQAYLQSCGIKSYLCSGALQQGKTFTDKDGEEITTWKPTEDHHFLMIEDNGKMFLLDPFNSRECSMPRVYNTGLTHEEFLEVANGNESKMLGFRGADLSQTDENLCLGYCKKNPTIQGIKVVNLDALNQAAQKNR